MFLKLRFYDIKYKNIDEYIESCFKLMDLNNINYHFSNIISFISNIEKKEACYFIEKLINLIFKESIKIFNIYNINDMLYDFSDDEKEFIAILDLDCKRILIYNIESNDDKYFKSYPKKIYNIKYTIDLHKEIYNCINYKASNEMCYLLINLYDFCNK